MAVPASIFARLREHSARFTAAGGDVIPLQIGDTHLPPPATLHELPWIELAPLDLYAYGSAFGDGCGGFARLCFTGVPAARLDEGVDRINAVLAGR